MEEQSPKYKICSRPIWDIFLLPVRWILGSIVLDLFMAQISEGCLQN